MRAAIFINPKANNGRAIKKWQQIESSVLQGLHSNTEVIFLNEDTDQEKLLSDLLNQNVMCFISAGGDGSVHYLLNNLIRTAGLDQLSSLAIGCIGLGSSNDFLKPINSKFGKVPVRINYSKLTLSDIGNVVYEDEFGKTHKRYFIVNSGIGVTASANYLFNNPDEVLSFLKKRWVDGAIVYTAVKSILHHRNIAITIQYNDCVESVVLSNLAVLKNPNVSGNFCYDQHILANDGVFGLNYCQNMTRTQLLRVLYDLSKAKFNGNRSPGRHSYVTSHIVIHSDQLIPLEMDGEVVLARTINYRLVPSAIHLME